MKVKGKVGPKGQVVMPKELREKFKISPGDEVSFDATEDAIIVHPPRDPGELVDELLGLVKGKKRLPKRVDWDELYYSQFR